MKNVILFDLDGTLVNSLEDLCDGVNYMLDKMELPHRSIEEVRTFVGNGIDMLVRRSVGNADFDFDTAMKYYREYYNENLCNKTKPYDGIYELLEELRSKGCKLGIVTNKAQWAADKIARYYFKGVFDVVIGADLSKRKKKPECDPVMAALDVIGSSKDKAIFVGDSDVDIATAKNMDMTFIGVTWGFRNEEIFADEKYFVKNSQELATLCCNFL